MLLARPVIGMLFHDRWLPAVPVLQWLSLGLATQPVGLVAAAVLMARGRFRALAGVEAFSAVATTCGAAVGACLGDQVQIAQGVSAGLLAANGYAGWRAFREFGPVWRALLTTIIPPLALVPPAVLAAGCLSNELAEGSVLVRIPAVTSVCLGVYAAALRIFLPKVAGEIFARVGLQKPLAPAG